MYSKSKVNVEMQDENVLEGGKPKRQKQKKHLMQSKLTVRFPSKSTLMKKKAADRKGKLKPATLATPLVRFSIFGSMSFVNLIVVLPIKQNCCRLPLQDRCSTLLTACQTVHPLSPKLKLIQRLLTNCHSKIDVPPF